jgi:hypothetical protein
VFNTADTYNSVSTDLKAKLATVTNSVQPLYTIAGNITNTVPAGSLVLTLPLSAPTVAADTLAGVISSASGGLVVASATSVTGSLVTALANKAGATGAVTTAYSTATHAATITVSPAAGFAFNETTNFYSAFTTALTTKITSGTNTNSVESTKVTVGSLTVTVSDMSIVISVGLGEGLPAATLVPVINGAADGKINLAFNWETYGTDITAAVITALAGSSATGAVTAATLTNASYQMTAVVITIQPGSGYVFSAAAGAYDTVATALTTKLGSAGAGNVTYDFGGPYTTGTVTYAITNGNLVLTAPLN